MSDLQNLPAGAATHLKRKTNAILQLHINTFHTAHFIHSLYQMNTKTDMAQNTNNRQQRPTAHCCQHCGVLQHDDNQAFRRNLLVR